MGTETSIDLGLVGPDAEDGPSIDPRGWWPRWRWLVSLGLLGVVALGLPAGGASPRPVLTLTATLEVGDPSLGALGGPLRLVGGYLVTLHPSGDSLAVRALPSGDVRWTSPSPIRAGPGRGTVHTRQCPEAPCRDEVTVIGESANGGTLFSIGSPRPDAVRLVRDLATGEILWSVPGDPLPGSGRLGLVARGETTNLGLFGSSRPASLPATLWQRIEVVDQTGAVRWSVTGEGTPTSSVAMPYQVNGDPVVIVHGPRRGVEVRTASDGEVRWEWDPPTGARVMRAFVVAGVLVVISVDEAETVRDHGFDLSAPDQPLWTRELSGGFACGAWLCLVARSPDGQDVSWMVHDPRTGEELWRTTGARLQPAGDRFVVRDGSGGAPTVVASATGEPVADLTGWAIAGVGADGTVLLRRPIPAGPAGAGTHRAETGDQGDTLLAALAPGGSAPRFLGVVDPPVYECRPFTSGVVCGLPDRRVGIWTWR